MSREVDHPYSEPVVLSDGDVEVAVTKRRTRNGERLQLMNRQTGSTIAIDALGLESLTWQDHNGLTQRLGLSTESWTPIPEVTGKILFTVEIVNEFTDVTVTGRQLDGREILTIDAPKADFKIQLTPEELGAIADRDMNLFSVFLETPYGP